MEASEVPAGSEGRMEMHGNRIFQLPGQVSLGLDRQLPRCLALRVGSTCFGWVLTEASEAPVGKAARTATGGSQTSRLLIRVRRQSDEDDLSCHREIDVDVCPLRRVTSV